MKKITITKNQSGERIDKFLKKEFFANEKFTRADIIRAIKKGDILVNGKKIKPSYVLKINDSLEINISRKDNRLKPSKEVVFKVVYQDENIIAVSKPSGLQVHPSAKNETGTLVNGLIHRFPEIKNVGDDPKIRPGIVHRLDQDTSGVMVIARSQKAFEELKRKFLNREIQKTYLAIVHGNFNGAEKTGVIEKPIARSGNYKKQVIAGRKTKTKIRPAITEYKVIKEVLSYSLLEARPKTGRMHQIRVHMSSIGHPIAGDGKYKLKNIQPAMKINRHLLHAQKIKFELFGKNYELEAKAPEDFNYFWNCLDEKLIRG